MRLKLSKVSRSFGAQKALDEISLDIEQCTSLVLVGPSGGGKSTLLRILAGLEKPDTGTVSINSQELCFEEEPLLKHRRGIGVVFQSFNLFPHLSALENILLPLTVVQKRTREEAMETAMGLLNLFE